jgi:hypothetical protein
MPMMPIPSRSEDIVESHMARLPIQLMPNPGGVTDQLRGISGTSSTGFHGNVTAGNAPSGIDHLSHREAMAIAKVVGGCCDALFQGF